jgi:hypothetical protein
MVPFSSQSARRELTPQNVELGSMYGSILSGPPVRKTPVTCPNAVFSFPPPNHAPRGRIMNLLHGIRRLLISEDGTTKIEYLVMVVCIIILCLSVFQVIRMIG